MKALAQAFGLKLLRPFYHKVPSLDVVISPYIGKDGFTSALVQYFPAGHGTNILGTEQEAAAPVGIELEPGDPPRRGFHFQGQAATHGPRDSEARSLGPACVPEFDLDDLAGRARLGGPYPQVRHLQLVARHSEEGLEPGFDSLDPDDLQDARGALGDEASALVEEPQPGRFSVYLEPTEKLWSTAAPEPARSSPPQKPPLS